MRNCPLETTKPALRPKSTLLHLILGITLFWTGLGVGENLSDSAFWIASTWSIIRLEWLFIVALLIFSRPAISITPPKEYRFVILAAIMWGVSVLLSYLLSPYYGWDDPLAIMRLTETYTHVLFFGAIWYFLSHFEVDISSLFIAAILPLLIVLGYFIYIHFAFPGLKADRDVFSMRSSDLLLNTHLHRIGYQVEAIIAMCLAFLFVRRWQVFTLAAIGILAVFLLWLGGRAALLGILLALLLFGIRYRKIFSRSALIGVSAIASLCLIAAPTLGLFDLRYITHAMHKTLESGSLDSLLTGRISLWGLALSQLDGYWLLGTGPQSYIFYPRRANDVIHAHNFILQFLTEWGIAGTVSFGLLMILALRRGFILHANETATEARYRIAAGFTILALTTTALFGGIYFFAQTSLYLAFVFALWITPSSP